MAINPSSLPYDLKGHVALVTGANHGIGAATACTLAGCGARVMLSFLCLSDPEDFAEPYRINRARDAGEVLALIRSRGGQATALEADLSDDSTPALLFDAAERELGPVDILINNATGWVSDTFANRERDDSIGVKTTRVSAGTYDRQFSVDARGGALMIAEFSRRHLDRGASWGRIIGLTSGGALGACLRIRRSRAHGACTASARREEEAMRGHR